MPPPSATETLARISLQDLKERQKILGVTNEPDRLDPDCLNEGRERSSRNQKRKALEVLRTSKSSPSLDGALMIDLSPDSPTKPPQNFRSNTWRAISRANAPSARNFHMAVWTGKKMIVWGGGNSVALLNDGGIYDPAADTDLI